VVYQPAPCPVVGKPAVPLEYSLEGKVNVRLYNGGASAENSTLRKIA
jgi:hypothetical protein